MAHLVFLFAKTGASAVPALPKGAEGAVAERFGLPWWRLQGGRGETPGASAQLR